MAGERDIEVGAAVAVRLDDNAAVARARHAVVVLGARCALAVSVNVQASITSIAARRLGKLI